MAIWALEFFAGRIYLLSMEENMKYIGQILVLILVTFFASSTFAGWKGTRKNYDCLEIEKFSVDRNDFSNRKRERAAAFPDEGVDALQHAIVGEVFRKNIFKSV